VYNGYQQYSMDSDGSLYYIRVQFTSLSVQGFTVSVSTRAVWGCPLCISVE